MFLRGYSTKVKTSKRLRRIWRQVCCRGARVGCVGVSIAGFHVIECCSVLRTMQCCIKLLHRIYCDGWFSHCFIEKRTEGKSRLFRWLPCSAFNRITKKHERPALPIYMCEGLRVATFRNTKLLCVAAHFHCYIIDKYRKSIYFGIAWVKAAVLTQLLCVSVLNAFDQRFRLSLLQKPNFAIDYFVKSHEFFQYSFLIVLHRPHLLWGTQSTCLDGPIMRVLLYLKVSLYECCKSSPVRKFAGSIDRATIWNFLTSRKSEVSGKWVANHKNGNFLACRRALFKQKLDNSRVVNDKRRF